MDKEELKHKLLSLIDNYKTYDADRLEHMSEDDTRSKFIDRLLKDVLGWEEEQLDRQKSIETKGNLKRSDYSYPNPVPKIIVEAKKIRVPLEEDDYDEQVQNYAYSKAVNWAILTNFRTFKAWYVTKDKIYPFCNIEDLLNGNIEYNIEKLYWLCKDNILNGNLDEEAKRIGIKLQDISITQDLSESLNSSREKINKYLKEEYTGYSDSDREELTQGIINRLIFIKKVEAEGLEENKLEQLIRNKETDIYDGLKAVFAYYRNKYDSDIFGQPHQESEAEKIYIKDKTTKELLQVISYPSNSNREYNFAAIDSDVLGSIYENYLAYIQKGIKLVGGNDKRKSQGIYYTPKFIVDYITINTLGALLGTSRNNKVKELKILDPACGSGSFLISVIALLDRYYSKYHKGYNDLSSKDKLILIKNNICGVDLDERAVSIAELNVYLKLLSHKSQNSIKNPIDLLPELRTNIKVGNSLIDDGSVAGDKAFGWEEKFKNITESGGFDVIVGNPPYGITFSDSDKKYIKEKYISASGNYDSYHYFIEKSIKLLKDGGFLGFITPDTWLTNVYTEKLRNLILESCKILQIVRLPQNVFSEANVDTCIIVLQKKSRSKENNSINVLKLEKDSSLSNLVVKKFDEHFTIKQNIWSNDKRHLFNINVSPKNFNLINKIKEKSVNLGDITEMRRGVFCYRKSSLIKEYGVSKGTEILQKRLWHSDKKVGLEYKKELLGSDIGRYVLDWKNKKWFRYGKFIASYVEPRFFDDGYIAVQRIRNPKLKNRLIATIIPKGQEYYASSGLTTMIISNRDFDEKYILGILNSKLMNWYYRQFFQDVNIKPEDMRDLPIKLASKNQINEIVDCVAKIIALNKSLLELSGKKTEEARLTEEQITKIDGKIDELVYKIYEITAEEMKIIEGS